jgi:hypothetical protein
LVDLVPPWWRRPLTHLEGTRAGDLGECMMGSMDSEKTEDVR